MKKQNKRMILNEGMVHKLESVDFELKFYMNLNAQTAARSLNGLLMARGSF